MGPESKATSTLVLDIETVPDRSLFTPPEPTPGQPAESVRVFPPLFACRPIVIGVLWLGPDLGLRRLGVFGEGKDEAGMLADFITFMEQERPRLVTWNGRGFDLPVLLLRALAAGLAWPSYYRDPDYRERRTQQGHLDLGDFLAEHGAARMTSLDGAARLIGLPGKMGGIDGSQVEALYQAGELEAVRRYCLGDVVQTAFIYLRSRVLVGELTRAEYQDVAARLLDGVAADPRVAALATATDRPRLLLGG